MSKKAKKQTALNETIQILINHNYWRRGGDEVAEMADPTALGIAIDHATSVLMQVENLIAQKGRHNTEIAYLGLVNSAEQKL